jgi:putative iron-regulated protein
MYTHLQGPQSRSRVRAGAVIAALALLVTPGRTAVDANGRTAIERAVIGTYAGVAAASYEDAAEGARALARSVDEFLASPNAEGFDRARHAWIEARIPYAQTEVFRFYDGPIDGVEGRVNSWPIDENLIDYVEGEPDAGIINQARRFPEIDAAMIASLNEKGGEKNITAGFHAIEFLLWGQDVNDDGPGQRSYLDYTDGHAPHAGRRRDYLRVATHLLVQDLASVASQWQPDREDNYRARFVALPPDEALTRILKGIGILSGSELAGERLTVPYETKEQEDEHSCFSDNTQRDIVNDAIGIESVVRGRYTRTGGLHVDGASLIDLLAHVDPATAQRLTQEVAASVAAARRVPEPFDRSILGTDAASGRVAVKSLITALRAQADTVAQAGAALGLRLNF